MKKDKCIDYNQKLDNALACCKRKCKCGHTKVVPFSIKRDYVLCGWCGSRIYFEEEKQQKYDEKVAKDNFIFQLNKVIQRNQEKKKMKKDRVVDKSKLKKKYFKNNSDYFAFCKDVTVQIYIVDTTSKTGKIIVYYGAKLGRPRKNINRATPDQYRKRKYYKNPYKQFFEN